MLKVKLEVFCCNHKNVSFVFVALAKAAGGGDSDFDFSGDDSDDEGSGLCNTILLVGPHGVGKTAAVYALAQQLSYKVRCKK